MPHPTRPGTYRQQRFDTAPCPARPVVGDDANRTRAQPRTPFSPIRACGLVPDHMPEWVRMVCEVVPLYGWHHLQQLVALGMELCRIVAGDMSLDELGGASIFTADEVL